MGFRVGLLQDFLAFLACLAVGIAASFAYPLATSLGVFVMCYALWLVFTSPLAKPERRAALDPRVSRASLGGLLLVVSTALILASAGLDLRVVALALIAVAAAATIYVHHLARKHP